MTVLKRASARVVAGIDQLTGWAGRDHWLVAASLVRVGFGSIVFLSMLICFPQRAFLFFNGGIETLDDFQRYVAPEWAANLFALPVAPITENVVYVGAMIVALLFTLGVWTRPISWGFAVVVWSLVHRCPGFIDGGYRLMAIMSIYLCFADLGRHFSVDALSRRHRGGRRAHQVLTMVHNAAIVTCIVQLCIVYLFSAFAKAQGASWQQGTALYYVLSEPEFNISPFSALILSSPALIALGTYVTLLFQSAFPWLLINDRCRFITVGVATALHVGIALSMGLFWFSAIMIVCECLVLTDSDYAVLAHLWSDFSRAKRNEADAAPGGLGLERS